MSARAWVVASSALLTAIVSAGPAAADGAQVSDLAVDREGSAVRFTLTGTDLKPGVGLDPGSVQVHVGQRRLVTSALVKASSSASPIRTRVILAIDVSGSMRGQALADAKTAANNFVAAVPEHVELGLVTFAEAPAVPVRPTTNRGAVLGAIARARAGGGTALYDALHASLVALGSAGDRRLVVISDGADTRSSKKLPGTIEAVKRSGATLEAVGLRTTEGVTATLQKLASAGHGRVLRTQDGRSLAAALTSTARAYATSLEVRALVPEELTTGVRQLSVTVATNGGGISARASADFGVPRRTSQPITDNWMGSRRSLPVGLAAIAAGLLLGTFVLVSGRERDRRHVRGVLDRYTTVRRVDERQLRDDSPVTRSALEFAERIVQRRGSQDRLASKLECAAIALAPSEWVLLQSGVAAAVVFLLILIGWNIAASILAGALLGFVTTTLYASMKASRRRAAFDTMLPDTLQLLSGSLSAGYSLAQSLDGVVREGSEPVSTEFGKALAESRIGIPIETTLEGVAARMGSTDFRWVVMAIRVQKEVGGNLAGVLATVASTMRERAMLRRHVKALAAEGKLSAYILLALPPGLAAYMLLLRPDYIRPLYTTSLGLTLIGVGLGLMVTGSLFMKKLVSVEV